ncbi:hypothetical protein FMEAI12_4870034 [Parafrankia sp. Ea1.12]|nr:hypothetical protein FMEAI12_4870034 [Parafrankia sp. Ea1.12]
MARTTGFGGFDVRRPMDGGRRGTSTQTAAHGSVAPPAQGPARLARRCRSVVTGQVAVAGARSGRRAPVRAVATFQSVDRRVAHRERTRSPASQVGAAGAGLRLAIRARYVRPSVLGSTSRTDRTADNRSERPMRTRPQVGPVRRGAGVGGRAVASGGGSRRVQLSDQVGGWSWRKGAGLGRVSDREHGVSPSSRATGCHLRDRMSGESASS